MSKISSYLSTISSIDWKKEAKETLLPVTASLGAGVIVNYNNPMSYALCYIARQSFIKPWNYLFSKTINQIYPHLNEETAELTKVALLALNVVTPFVVSYKVCQYAGYQISPYWWLVGSVVGGIAHTFVQQKLQENPFKKSDIMTIDKNNFQKEVIESDLPVVLDAYASWCPPCRAMAPIVLKVSQELRDKVKFVKFNINEDSDLAKKLDIQSIPTFMFFNHGKEVEIHRGGLPESDFKDKIEKLFSPTR